MIVASMSYVCFHSAAFSGLLTTVYATINLNHIFFTKTTTIRQERKQCKQVIFKQCIPKKVNRVKISLLIVHYLHINIMLFV